MLSYVIIKTAQGCGISEVAPWALKVALYLEIIFTSTELKTKNKPASSIGRIFKFKYSISTRIMESEKSQGPGNDKFHEC